MNKKLIVCPLCGKPWDFHYKKCEGMKSPTGASVLGHSIKSAIEGK